MEQKRLNREQQEVLALLKEVDMICRKHQITYYLSPRLTLCAVTGKPFPLSPLTGAVLMKLPDMERFREAAEGELVEGRALESMKNNPRFPGLFLRYENKNTLCYRLNEGRNYQYPGIGVDIIPLRSKNPSKKIRSWDTRLETGWIQTCDGDEPGFYNFACGWWMRLFCISGRARVGSRLYDRLVKNQDTAEAKKYILRWNRRYSYEYAPDIFREAKDVVLEGYTFRIPCEEKEYLRRTFGPRYETRTFSENAPGMSVMVSAGVSCEDFLKESGPSAEFIRSRRRISRRGDFVRKHYKEYFDWCWNYAKSCAERQELRKEYRKKKEYIKNLWENRDFIRLDEAFHPYKTMTKRCLETGEIFEADGEIHEIFLNYLKEDGYQKLLEQIENCRG